LPLLNIDWSIADGMADAQKGRPKPRYAKSFQCAFTQGKHLRTLPLCEQWLHHVLELSETVGRDQPTPATII